MVTPTKDREDMKRLIRLFMNTPLKNMPTVDPEKATCIESYNKQNTDVKTAMTLAVIKGAIKGDLKCAEFLMKYGGFELPKEANITVDTPNIINDMGAPIPEEESEEQEETVDAVIYDDPSLSTDL